ncbi:MAG TPA: hypothetical protein VF622_03940 [Segetibacter sp.]|jgi:hypothetical protein
MEEFKADILSTNKKGRLYFYLFVALMALVIAFLLYLQVIPFFLEIFSIMIWLFAILKYVLQTKKQVLKKSFGELRISEDQISIFNNDFSLHEIKSFKLSISGWRSYKRSSDRSQPVSNMHNGDKNYLTVVVNDQTTKCEFLLISKEHWQHLREHVMNWYYLNLNVSEDNNGGRSYGLECLNYNEIQEFKKHIHTLKISGS